MSDNSDDNRTPDLPAPEGPPKAEHGAQVRLTGIAQAAARGAAHASMLGNIATKAAMEGGAHDAGASPEHQRKMDPADGSEMERRIRERGEAGRVPTGEDDEAVAADTAPTELREQLQPTPNMANTPETP